MLEARFGEGKSLRNPLSEQVEGVYLPEVSVEGE